MMVFRSSLLTALVLTLIPVSLSAIESLPKMDLAIAWPNLTVERPICTAVPPDGSGRIFLVEQEGKILILPADRSAKHAALFLDITKRKPLVEPEEGLLGFTFHPDFQKNGKFYICYTQQDPRRSVISEFKVSSGDPGKADLSTERVLLEIPQPFGNHNSGSIVFGLDGYLYISSGDGGSANDPQGNSQNLTNLLGCVLRIDVNAQAGGKAYAIPKDNPFLGRGEDALPEIWAYGFRNPWRMSLDNKTGDLWLGDVGQVKWEEVNRVVRGGNYGWNAREGFHSFNEKKGVAVNHIAPVIEYPHIPGMPDQVIDHGVGLSVTGGFVYRGKKYPKLKGAYVYADYVIGTIWGLRYQSGKLSHHGVLVEAPMEPRKDKKPVVRAISGFGEDPDGELLILAFDGRIYELVAGE